jgi:hypothetical protein
MLFTSVLRDFLNQIGVIKLVKQNFNYLLKSHKELNMHVATAPLSLTVQSQANSINQDIHHSITAISVQNASTQNNVKLLGTDIPKNSASEFSDKASNFNLTRLLASSCDCV